MTNEKNKPNIKPNLQEAEPLKKYAKLARTSMLAISMGMSLHPGALIAAENPTQQDHQLISSAPTMYTGNSLSYFQNEFLTRSSFQSLSSGEGVGTVPVASNVAIAGSAVVGQTLVGSYDFFDAEGDTVSGATYQWYRSDNSSKMNHVLINGATSESYVLQAEDLGKYISFEVTPRSNNEPTTGSAVESVTTTSAVLAAPAAPIASNVTITGSAVVGQTLTGSYTYYDANGDTVSGSTYQWYRSDDALKMTNHVLINGATSESYVLQSEDIGKYISFEVTPRTNVSPPTGTAVESSTTERVASLPQNPDSSPSSNSTSDESTLDALAVKKNEQTSAAAKLLVTKDKEGKTSAIFNLLSEGIEKAALAANEGETIAVRSTKLKDASRVQADLTGDSYAALANKKAKLSIQTGDVAIEFPTNALQVNNPNKQLKITIQIEKQPEDVKHDAEGWTKTQNATIVGDPYRFNIQVEDGSKVDVFTQYGNHYASQTLPIPTSVKDVRTLGAVMLKDGRYVPVPVLITDDGLAVVQTPTNATVMLVQQNLKFPDIQTHWGAEAITSLANKGMLAGDSLGNLDPDRAVTRSEFASILVRSLGLGLRDIDSSLTSFKDLPTDEETKRNIQIAVDAGLFNGLSADTFGPDQLITREQMASVLMRFSRNFGIALSDTNTNSNLSELTDLNQVSDWAKNDLSEAVAAGLFTGYQDNTIGSKKSGTRVESALVLLKFLHQTGLTN